MKKFIVSFLIMILLAGAAKDGAQAASHAETIDILLYGDSLLSGYRLAPQENLAVLLEKKLTQDDIPARVKNLSVVGQTSGGGAKGIDKALQQHADLVVLEFGGNDVYHHVSAATVKKNLQFMISRVTAQHGQVLLVGNRSAALAGIYNELAKENNLVLYPYMLLGVAGQRNLLQDDNTHPNATGVGVMLQYITPAIEKILRP